MKLKKIALIVFILGSLGSSLFFFLRKPTVYKIPVGFLPESKMPLARVMIEGQLYQLGIDLGANGGIYLRQHYLQSLKTKRSDGNVILTDTNGGKYIQPSYILPLAMIENYVASNISLTEDNLEFLANGSVVLRKIGEKPGEKRFPEECEMIQYLAGSIGFPFFKDHNLFFDFLHGYIYIGESYNALKERKIFSENALEVNLKKTNQGFIIELETDFGVKNFLLDTGFLWASLKSDRVPRDRILELFPGRNICATKSIGIKDKKLRNLFLYILDTDVSSIEIDGCLGMIFLTHPIYFDVKNHKCYIEPMDVDFDAEDMVRKMIKLTKEKHPEAWAQDQ